MYEPLYHFPEHSDFLFIVNHMSVRVYMYVKYKHIQMYGGRMDKMDEGKRVISPLCDDVVY